MDTTDIDWTATSAEIIDWSDTEAHGNSINMDSTNVTTSKNGQFGQALSFNGTDEYIDIGPGVNDTLDGTVAFWVKSTLDSAQTVWSIGMQASSSNKETIYIGNGVTGSLTNELVTVAKVNESGDNWMAGYTTSTRSELFDGAWHHVVVVFNGGLTLPSIYLDGSLKTTSITDVAPPDYDYGYAGADNSTIGAVKYSGTVGGYLNGSLDEFRIYNRSLSAAEVTALYNLTAQKVRISN